MQHSHTPLSRRWLARGAIALVITAGLVGCGGGADVVVSGGPPPVDPLNLALTRVGPQSIQVGWSDHPGVASFDVLRDGYRLTTVNSTSLIDNSVYVNQTYCYQVMGYDPRGYLIAATDAGCITVVP
ncbi:hypothetical protein [Curvibacter lanceolatus]|jgi:hypothetical protein|uniref:hypothetical protein n=1 Tax=Curvibacter lanceolatus TaxID=86182 RepID=UPI000367A68E|nr:hypothetical protein [Curvibacter lanceolatus]